MKKVIIIALFLLTASSFAAAGKSQDILNVKYGYLTVFTKYEVIYDDGIYRKIYQPFEISNKDGLTVLKVGSSLDEPKRVKLSEGTYIFKTKEANNLIIKTVDVKFSAQIDLILE